MNVPNHIGIDLGYGIRKFLIHRVMIGDVSNDRV